MLQKLVVLNRHQYRKTTFYLFTTPISPSRELISPVPQEKLNALNIWQLEGEVGTLQTEFVLRMIGTVNTFILEASCKSHPQAFPLLGCAKEEEEQQENKCRAEERA